MAEAIRERDARTVAVPADLTAPRAPSEVFDAVVGNLAYGASKGALDRIVTAAARELAHLRVSANVVNPGPVDTGWMTDRPRADIATATPLGRGGTPQDAAALVSFLCSADGGWVNGQLISSDGGLHV